MTRQRHSNAGPRPTPAQLRATRVYIDALSLVDQAITRIANYLRTTPDAGLKVQLAGLRIWRGEFVEQRRRAGV